MINGFSVFPNPSDKFFNIQFNSEVSQDFELRILNYLGELIYFDAVKNHIGEYNQTLDFSNYSKAIYFLEIQTEYGTINKKLIVQ